VRGDRYIESGSGAHGFLALVPIVNLDATQAQLDAILARLLLLENAGAPPQRP
jgi:L-cysteine desulfidase